MKLKAIILCAIILIITFILILTLRPQNSIENLHDTMEHRHSILLSPIALEDGLVEIPHTFDDQWTLLESTVRENNYSLRGYRGKQLTRYTYYVLDSPFHRSMRFPDVSIYMNVYADKEKIVAAYLFIADEPKIPYPLDHVE